MSRTFFALLVTLLLVACGDSSPLVSGTPFVPENAAPAAATAGPGTVPVATLPAASQCQSRLFGKLLDPSGQPAHSGSVDISNGQVTASAVPDPNGLYGFAGLCAGTYSFTVTVPGRAPQALPERISVDGSNTVIFDIRTR